MKHIYIITLLSIITISTLHAADSEQQLIDLIKRGIVGDFEDNIRKCLNRNDVNILFNGMGFLHWAAVYGAIDIMEMLHRKGAEIDLPNTIVGGTPLHTAAFFGQLKAVTFLLEHGADRDKRNLFEETPAEVARDYGNPDIANFIDNWQDLLEIKEPDVE